MTLLRSLHRQCHAETRRSLLLPVHCANTGSDAMTHHAAVFGPEAQLGERASKRSVCSVRCTKNADHCVPPTGERPDRTFQPHNVLIGPVAQCHRTPAMAGGIATPGDDL